MVTRNGPGVVITVEVCCRITAASRSVVTSTTLNSLKGKKGEGEGEGEWERRREREKGRMEKVGEEKRESGRERGRKRKRGRRGEVGRSNCDLMKDELLLVISCTNQSPLPTTAENILIRAHPKHCSIIFVKFDEG